MEPLPFQDLHLGQCGLDRENLGLENHQPHFEFRPGHGGRRRRVGPLFIHRYISNTNSFRHHHFGQSLHLRPKHRQAQQTLRIKTSQAA